MILLLVLLCSIWGEPALALEKNKAFSLGGDLHQVSVSHDSVYISTEEKLYQLSHDLTVIHSLNQRGILKNPGQLNGEEFHRVSMDAAWNATFTINVLLPLENNGTLIICGATDKGCGYCEVLDLRDISKLVFREHIQVGPQRNSRGSVSFLVDVKKDSGQTETYILTAIQNHREKPEESRCPSELKTINLQNTDQKQSGGIFAWSEEGETPGIQTEADVDFVDGFQINSTVSLFSNVASGAKTNKVRLIWLQAETSKAQTLKSLGGATLSSSDGGEGSRLLASSLVPGGQQVLWSGVFSLDGGETNTELLLFDISPDQSRTTDTDPDFYYSSNRPNKPSEAAALKPKAKLFRKNHMSSVLAVRLGGWMVFFIGTTDGQLIKLAVDRNHQPACPKILYRTSGDYRVFPKIHLDPVDQSYVYAAFKNQVKHVPVSNCGAHQHVKDCLSAQDPFCVWCLTELRCTFKGKCKDGDWFSIPDESKQKLVSHIIMHDSTGEIKLIIQTHLTLKQTVPPRFACHFSSSTHQPCKETGPPPQYPRCTCLLNDSLPPDDVDVDIKIRLGGTILADKIKVSNCLNITGEASLHLCQRCIRVGCGWRQNRCSWATDPVQNESICENMEFKKNFSKPEISSISPSVVSFYGRNHAVLSGHNLRAVTRVRIQDNMGCDPKESAVLNNNGSSLMFHVPSAEMKGMAKVCALLLDGSCHGNLAITYQSSPTCSDIVPAITWRSAEIDLFHQLKSPKEMKKVLEGRKSGKRKVTLIGTSMHLVDGVTHSSTQQEVIPSRSRSYQNLTYETPAETDTRMLRSPVFLKVANETLKCNKEIVYYPDPEFNGFTAVKEGMNIRISIQKKADNLEMKPEELDVWGTDGKKQHQCNKIFKESGIETETFICEIEGMQNSDFKQVQIKYGGKSLTLNQSSRLPLYVLLVILLIPVLITVVYFIYRKRRKHTAEPDESMGDLEFDNMED